MLLITVSSLRFTVIVSQRKKTHKCGRCEIDMTQYSTIEWTSLLSSPDAALFTLNSEAEVRSSAAGKCGIATHTDECWTGKPWTSYNPKTED